jgi:hypothetical protein
VNNPARWAAFRGEKGDDMRAIQQTHFDQVRGLQVGSFPQTLPNRNRDLRSGCSMRSGNFLHVS